MADKPTVEITARDLRQASIDAGLDPDKWAYTRSLKGWDIKKGLLNVGTLVFEDHAKILVRELNASPKV